MDFIYCWILIANLQAPTTNYMPPKMEQRLHVCSNILSYTPKDQSPALALAIGWEESAFTDARGRWLCTRKGILYKTKSGTHRCKTAKGRKRSKLVRAVGPMQILKIYHCKGNPKCNTTKAGVHHLYSLVSKYKSREEAIAIYAGGYVNPKSSRYARRAIRLEKKIKGILPAVQIDPYPKDLMLWKAVK
jgi:hypothetical protein